MLYDAEEHLTLSENEAVSVLIVPWVFSRFYLLNLKVGLGWRLWLVFALPGCGFEHQALLAVIGSLWVCHGEKLENISTCSSSL